MLLNQVFTNAGLENYKEGKEKPLVKQWLLMTSANRWLPARWLNLKYQNLKEYGAAAELRRESKHDKVSTM